MAKKDFTAEFSELLGVAPVHVGALSDTATPQDETPNARKKTATPKTAPRRKYGTAPTKNAAAEEQRCTFSLDADVLSRLRGAAYSETGRQGVRVTIKDVLTEALQDYFTKKGY